MVGREHWVDVLSDALSDVLSEPPPGRSRVSRSYPEVIGARGLRVTHKASGFTGVIVRFERDGVVLKGVTGLERIFRLAPGSYAMAGTTVTLVAPKPVPTPIPRRTPSGSTAVPPEGAKVARASRILVEGIHDAQLVERVWGDDLRVEGVVVERLDGLDRLAAAVAEFRPGPGRRLGVLVDHLVPGSKESKLVAGAGSSHVLITGTPFIDIWQAVKPSVVGIPAWPDVPFGVDWKTGVCVRLGVADPALMWRRILASVNSYADLLPALIGAVEELIDFVTAEGVAPPAGTTV